MSKRLQILVDEEELRGLRDAARRQGLPVSELDAQRLLETALSAGERLLTDAEALQEICHRYTAIGRRDMLQPAFDAILGVVDEVLPIDRADAEVAKDIVLRYASLSARDAVYIAVMRQHGIDRIMTFDRGFDAQPGIDRLH